MFLGQRHSYSFINFMAKCLVGSALGLGFTVSAHAELGEIGKISEKQFESCENFLKGDALEAAIAKWAGKTVVLDTNVILNDAHAIYKYPGATVVIPGTVLEEIDDKKSDEKLGFMARRFTREVDSMLQAGENLRKGVELYDDTILKVDTRNMTHMLNDTTFDKRKKDNEIVSMALAYKKEAANSEKDEKVFLISDDMNVRIKASSEELVALPFEYEWVTPASEIEAGMKSHTLSQEAFEAFNQTGELALPHDLAIRPNEFVNLRTETFEGGGPDTIARYVYDRENPEKSSLRRMRSFDFLPEGIRPRNIEQAMALELALDPTVELVFLESEAGTGKSFIALLAGMLQIPSGSQNPIYEDMMITRIMAEVGGFKLGTLPGDKNQKLSEAYNSFFDNLRILKAALIDNKGKQSNSQNKDQRRNEVDKGLGITIANIAASTKKTEGPKKIVTPKNKNGEVKINGVELLNFSTIRGRSLHNTFAVVDESQNFNAHEIKTMLTRIGEGSKVMVLGDVTQIDLPYLNSRNNGLSVATSLFINDELNDYDRSRVGFIRMTIVERSELSDLSIRVFKKYVPRGR